MSVMEQLVEQMKVVQATAFSLYLKAHNYHWNVTGPNFAQYHEFFGDFYNDVWASVDTHAEKIRVLEAFAPGSYTRFGQLSKIQDETTIPDAPVMFKRLAEDNYILIQELFKARNMAEENKEFGLVNHLEDRLDVHDKWQWMLKSF